jgi:3-dehydroquinate synthase
MTAGTTRIHVATRSPYDVVIGTGILDEVAALVGPDAQRVAVVHSERQRPEAGAVGDRLRARGYDVHALEVPDGEVAKSAAVAAACWGELGRRAFTRSDAVVAVGGGATTDLTGFVAGTFLRGIRVVHVPTTLLAMVDAAVGGKTGINTAAGKNLVGCFHEPAGVVCDLTALTTLPPADLVSGLAEVVKCGLIADRSILDLVTTHPRDAVAPASSVLKELVERAVSVKARIVAADLRESLVSGPGIGREALNYGHTLGHAIERVEGYTFRHGAAVSIGMVYAAELASLAGRLDSDTVALHRDLLRSVGLPTSYPAGRWADLREAMRVDKKTRGDRLRFVVLGGVGQPAILDSPVETQLAQAYAAIAS